MCEVPGSAAAGRPCLPALYWPAPGQIFSSKSPPCFPFSNLGNCSSVIASGQEIPGACFAFWRCGVWLLQCCRRPRREGADDCALLGWPEILRGGHEAGGAPSEAAQRRSMQAGGIVGL